MAVSIGGLGSGVDTSTVVAQLMQAESATRTKLQGSKGALTVETSAWNSLSTMAKGLQDKATALQDAARLRASTVRSSAPEVATATSSPTAKPGSLTFRVTQLATRHQLALPGAASAGAPVGSGVVAVASGLAQLGATLTPPAEGTTGRHVVVVSEGADGELTATVDGEGALFGTDADGAVVLDVAGATLRFAGTPRPGTAVVAMAATDDETTLQGLAAELTAAGAPAGASVIHDGSTGGSPYRLVLAAEGTGRAGALTVAVSPGLSALAGASSLTEAKDAVLTIGDGPSAITVQRSSNTITDALDGVTLTLVTADPAKEITVSAVQDDDAAVSKVKGLADTLNGFLSWIATNTKYDVASKSGGPLVGDAGVRALAGQVRGAVQTALPEGSRRTAAAIGLSANRSGTYDLDETALRAALKDDPEAVGKVVAGLAAAVGAVAKAANETNGVVKTGQRSVESASRALQERIDVWDARLKAVESRYTRQFNALDVAMSKLSSQGSWLAGQLKSLPSPS